MTRHQLTAIISTVEAAFAVSDLKIRDLETMLELARKELAEREVEIHRLADRVIELEDQIAAKL